MSRGATRIGSCCVAGQRTGADAPEPPGRSFLDGDDDAAEEDALAGEEDEEGREGRQDEGGLDDAGAGALLELVEPDHQGPHFRGTTLNLGAGSQE